MAKRTVNIIKELGDKGISLFLGGYGDTIEVEELSEREVDSFEKFFKESEESLRDISNKLANIFVAHKDLIFFMVEHFKAKIGKTFGGQQPGSSDFGIALTAPWLINWDGAQPTAYGGNSWIISTTAGTRLYLLGSSTAFYRARSDSGYRMLHIILQNGIFSVGTSPGISQIRVLSEKVTQPPFHVMPAHDVPVDRYPIYILTTPYAIPVWYDMGVKVEVMPYVSQSALDLRLLGVTLYEYNAWRDLTYIT